MRSTCPRRSPAHRTAVHGRACIHEPRTPSVPRVPRLPRLVAATHFRVSRASWPPAARPRALCPHVRRACEKRASVLRRSYVLDARTYRVDRTRRKRSNCAVQIRVLRVRKRCTRKIFSYTRSTYCARTRRALSLRGSECHVRESSAVRNGDSLRRACAHRNCVRRECARRECAPRDCARLNLAHPTSTLETCLNNPRP